MILALIFYVSTIFSQEVPPFSCEFASEEISGKFSVTATPFANSYQGKIKGKPFSCNFTEHKATLTSKKDQADRYDINLYKLKCKDVKVIESLPLLASLRIDRLRSGRGYAFFRPFDSVDSLPCAIASYDQKGFDKILFPPKKKIVNKIKAVKKAPRKVKDKRVSLKLKAHRPKFSKSTLL